MKVTNTPMDTARQKFITGSRLMFGPLNCSSAKSSTIMICSAGVATRGEPCMPYPMANRYTPNMASNPGMVVITGTIQITAKMDSA